MVYMTFEEWIKKYKPIKNNFGDVGVFETYGKDVEFVKTHDNSYIWTLCSGDYGDYVTNGWHFVNRIGYYITEIPFEKDEYIFVNIENETEE